MFTLGALHALQSEGCRIIEIAAASSGVMNAAYFLADQTEQAREVYGQLVSTDFIEMKALPPIMRIEYVWDLVFGETSPYKLDIDKVIDSGTELIMPLLNVDTGEEEVFTNRTEPERLIQILKASIAVPVWYGGVVSIGHFDYIDGAAVNPFPAGLVKRQDTRLVGISTKRRPFLYTPNKTIYSAYAQKQYGAHPEQAKGLQARKIANVDAAKSMINKRQAQMIKPITAFHQLTNDGKLLEGAFRDGEQAVNDLTLD